MPYKEPPIKNRFTKENPGPRHTQKGPYLVPLLKKFLDKRIDLEDPETKKMVRGKVKDAVIWRLILNATQGENEAIKEILNRIDGKLTDVEIDNSQHTHYNIKWKTNGKLPERNHNRLLSAQATGDNTQRSGKV